MAKKKIKYVVEEGTTIRLTDPKLLKALACVVSEQQTAEAAFIVASEMMKKARKRQWDVIYMCIPEVRGVSSPV